MQTQEIRFKNLNEKFRKTVDAQITANNCLKIDCATCPFSIGETPGVDCEVANLVCKFGMLPTGIKLAYINQLNDMIGIEAEFVRGGTNAKRND
jgi:hypothetical protein